MAMWVPVHAGHTSSNRAVTRVALMLCDALRAFGSFVTWLLAAVTPLVGIWLLRGFLDEQFLLMAVGTVAVLEVVVSKVAITSNAVVIVAPTLDVVNVKVAPNSSPEAKLDE